MNDSASALSAELPTADPLLLHPRGAAGRHGAAAGIGGTVLFGAIGLAAVVPMLLKLRRRLGTRWALGIAVAVFAAMFAVSTFLIGPLRSGGEHPSEPGPPVRAGLEPPARRPPQLIPGD